MNLKRITKEDATKMIQDAVSFLAKDNDSKFSVLLNHLLRSWLANHNQTSNRNQFSTEIGLISFVILKYGSRKAYEFLYYNLPGMLHLH